MIIFCSCAQEMRIERDRFGRIISKSNEKITCEYDSMGRLIKAYGDVGGEGGNYSFLKVILLYDKDGKLLQELRYMPLEHNSISDTVNYTRIEHIYNNKNEIIQTKVFEPEYSRYEHNIDSVTTYLGHSLAAIYDCKRNIIVFDSNSSFIGNPCNCNLPYSELTFCD